MSFLGGFGGVSVVPAVFGVVTFPVNVGGKRAWVAASNPEASLISVGSLNAVPRKLMLRPRRRETLGRSVPKSTNAIAKRPLGEIGDPSRPLGYRGCAS